MRQQQYAFSLVELSIVLVILGLLTGGILAGQSLIRASELRSIPAQAEKFRTAASAFRDKYMAIPGDMAKATSFWGALDGGDGLGTDCTTLASTSALTCNGDGNGFVASTGTSGTSTYNYEMFRAWQHLANAGLIEGTYTGVTGAGGTNHHIPGTNAPAGRLTGSGWATSYGYPGAGSATDFVFTRTGHYVQLGAANATTTPNSPILKPEEAWNIDTKTDDGLPGQGNVGIKYWDTCSTAADFSDINAPYDLGVTTAECVIKFYRQY